MLNMQNVKDIEIQEGDVRTIHDKDNRLIWGRLTYDTKYAGDTYQQTYSGKNLLTGDYSSATVQGVGRTWSNVYVSLSGTASTQYVNITANLETPLSSGTYTLSSDVASSVITKVIRVRYDGANHDYTISKNATSVTFTIPDGASNPVIMLFYISGFSAGAQISDTFGLMLESGSSASPFEPYTGGIPAPNPDYPQDIQVVTGEQTVEVHGKNMIPFTNQNVTIGTLNAYSQNGSLYLNGAASASIGSNSTAWKNNFKITLPAGTYTLSGDTSRARTIRKESDGSVVLSLSIGTSSGTFTLTEETKVYFGLYISGGASFSNYKFDAQLERSSTATAYEPYQGAAYTIDLGSIELCKIGDYRDYIYKSGDDWYVHKAIDTQVVDTSNITARTTYSNLDYAVYPKSATSIFYDNYDEMGYPLLCTHATHFAPGNFDTTNNIGGVFMSGQRTNWWIGFAKNTSLDTMKSDLSGCKLYSPLATPTDTQITDATLVGQLNAVHEWLTRYGYSATVTGNLPIIINQTNL